MLSSFNSLPSSSTIIECINDNNKQGPEKVKSRWRRNSELEITSTTLSPMDSTPSSPTGQQHSTINSSQESLNPIMIADSPMPSYQQIDENIFLFEKYVVVFFFSNLLFIIDYKS